MANLDDYDLSGLSINPLEEEGEDQESQESYGYTPPVQDPLSDYDLSGLSTPALEPEPDPEEESFFGDTFKGMGTTLPASFKKGLEGVTSEMKLAAVENIPDPDELELTDLEKTIGQTKHIPSMVESAASLYQNMTGKDIGEMKEAAVSSIMADIKQDRDLIKQHTTEGLNVVQQGIRSGLESTALNAGPVVAGMIATAITKNPYVGTAFSSTPLAAQVAGDSYVDARLKGLEVEAANQFGAVDGGLEFAFGAVPDFIQNSIFKDAITKGGTKLGDWLKPLVLEIAGENATTAYQDINSYLNGLDEEMGKGTLMEEAELRVKRQAVTTIAATVGTALQQGAMATVGKVVGPSEVHKSDADVVEEIMDDEVDLETAMEIAELYSGPLSLESPDAEPLALDAPEPKAPTFYTDEAGNVVPSTEALPEQKEDSILYVGPEGTAKERVSSFGEADLVTIPDPTAVPPGKTPLKKEAVEGLTGAIIPVKKTEKWQGIPPEKRTQPKKEESKPEAPKKTTQKTLPAPELVGEERVDFYVDETGQPRTVLGPDGTPEAKAQPRPTHPPITQTSPTTESKRQLDKVEQEVAGDVVKGTKLPENFPDPRLKRSNYRGAIETMGRELVKGGGVAYVRSDAVAGSGDQKVMTRTKSENPDWFKDYTPEKGKKPSVLEAKVAIAKALKGEKLKAHEARFVEYTLDHHLYERTEDPEIGEIAARKVRLEQAREKRRKEKGLVTPQKESKKVYYTDMEGRKAAEAKADKKFREETSPAGKMGIKFDDFGLDPNQDPDALDIPFGAKAPNTKSDKFFKDFNPEDMQDITPKSGFYENYKAADRALQQRKKMKDKAPGQMEKLERYSPYQVEDGKWVLRADVKKKSNRKETKDSFQGLELSIENKVGEAREGKDSDGREWRTILVNDYGYIKGTKGKDGDEIDIFLGDNKDSDTVFVFNQIDPKTKKFDEHKVMLGFDNSVDAVKAYQGNYEQGWKGRGKTTKMTMAEFKEWLANGDHTRAIKQVDADKIKDRTKELREDFDLKQETEAEATKREAETKAKAEAKKATEKKAEKKDEADKQVDEFSLTGSDQEADIAMAKGQASLFDQPVEDTAVETPTKEIETFGEFKTNSTVKDELIRITLTKGSVKLSEKHESANKKLGLTKAQVGKLALGEAPKEQERMRNLDVLVVEPNESIVSDDMSMDDYIDLYNASLAKAQAEGYEAIAIANKDVKGSEHSFFWTYHESGYMPEGRGSMAFFDGYKVISNPITRAHRDQAKDRRSEVEKRLVEGRDAGEFDKGVKEPTPNYATDETLNADAQKDLSSTKEEAHSDPEKYAKRAVNRLDRIKGSMLANAMAADYKDQGFTSIIGKPAKSTEDIAIAAQVYRNPSFETSRFFFVKDGVVVGQTGATSRMPGYVRESVPLSDLKTQMENIDADGYYLMHNHPSGSVTPSQIDIDSTLDLNSRLSGFLGHIIVNETKYATIDAEGNTDIRDIAKTKPEYDLNKPAKSGNMLGTRIDRPDVIARVGTEYYRPDWMVLVGRRGGDGAISGIMEVDASILDTESDVKLLVLLQEFQRQTGSLQVALANVPIDKIDMRGKLPAAIRAGHLLDVLDTNGESLRNKGIQPIERLVEESKRKGFQVAEETPDYETDPILDAEIPEVMAEDDPRIEIPERTGWDGWYAEVQRKFVDRLQAFRTTQKAIEDMRGDELPDIMDFDAMATTMPGTQREEYNDWLRDEFKPFRDAIYDSNMSFREASEFLHARHAEEANEHMKERNPGIDSLSGLSNKMAQKIIDRFEERYGSVYEIVGDINKPQFEAYAAARKKYNKAVDPIEPTDATRKTVEDFESVYGDMHEVLKDFNKKQFEAYQNHKRLYNRATKAESLNAELEAIARKGMSKAQAESIIKQIEAVPHQQRTPNLKNKLIVARARLQAPFRTNDDLSGMSNDEADEILKKYKDNPAAQKIGEMNDKMNENRIDYLVDNGLISEQEAVDWRDNYDHYVPLQREDLNNDTFGNPRSRGLDARGRPVRVRAGSKLKVDHANMIAHIGAQHAGFIAKTNKNRLVETLYNLAEANPSPDLWKVDELPAGPAQLSSQGTAMWPATVNAEGVIGFRRNGENVYMTINPRHDHGKLMIRALDSMGQGLSKFAEPFARLNRMLSQLNTSWSPPFILTNAIKDIQAAAYNLTDTQLENHIWEVVQPKALNRARNAIRSSLYGDGSHPDADLFDEFRRAGGTVGWVQSHENIEDYMAEIQREVSGWEVGGHKVPGRKNVQALFKFVSDRNSVAENMVRFSAYKVAREQLGLSKLKAAKLSKELTVDFNRKGEWGSHFNAFYMFWNAGVQGNSRLLRAALNLKNKKIQKLLMATVGFAVTNEIVNHIISAAEDDDDDSGYAKIRNTVGTRNMIIMTGEDTFVSVPLPWGYNVVHLGGQMFGGMIANKLGLYSSWDGTDDVARTTMGVLSAFNPMMGPTPLQAASPTFFEPFARIGENTDWHGGPLYPNFSQEAANFRKYYSSASDTSKFVAKGLYDTFVDPETTEISGLFDWSPEWTDMAFEFLTGGFGKFFLKDLPKFGEALGRKALSGESLRARDVPFLNKFYGEVDDSVIKSDYYDKLYSILNMSSEHERTKKENYQEYLNLKEAAGHRVSLIHRAKFSRGRVRDLKVRIKKAEDAGDRVEVQKLEADMIKHMRGFASHYNKKVYGDPEPFEVKRKGAPRVRPKPIRRSTP